MTLMAKLCVFLLLAMSALFLLFALQIVLPGGVGATRLFFYVAMVVIPIYVYAFGLCVVSDKFFATGAAFSIVLMILLLFGYYLRPETPHGVKGSLHQALCIGHY
ncbi:hypothetical protein CEK28_07960 [Xenophilus sp. AP218F]|nr:hypothetical protein CEK28_07960 [Xenophilus sp. AP218F]